ncbi:MAG TPA: FMN-binding negative transcriptional regulator [Rhizomicrobium sp.]|nr:FMN-binding negative transcriptional regulator [Rhizomicrobium sp.]
MYRPAHFAVDDADTLHAFIRSHPFATVAAVIGGAVHFAYAPVVLDAPGTVRFHLARANPLAQLGEGARVRLSFMGPHAYVSPDWYATPGMVPTWNYMAVEGEGAVTPLRGEALVRLLADLSAAEEAHLRPKKPWTIDKVPEPKMTTLKNAIVGLEVVFDTLSGKFKLSQNVKPEDRAGAIAGLESRGDPQSAATAREMRKAGR